MDKAMIHSARWCLGMLCLLALVGCRSSEEATSFPETGEVTFVEHSSRYDGTITVHAVGYGRNMDQAVRYAEESAFKALLFRGIPGSNQVHSMVEKPSEKQTTHDSYFKDFFEGGAYMPFMMASELVSAPPESAKVQRVVVELVINQHSLRKELESRGIIRKFGL